MREDRGVLDRHIARNVADLRRTLVSNDCVGACDGVRETDDLGGHESRVAPDLFVKRAPAQSNRTAKMYVPRSLVLVGVVK